MADTFSPDQPGHRNPGRAFLIHLKNKLGAGLLVVIPVGITLFILRFLFRLADGFLAPYLKRLAPLFEAPYFPGAGMIAGIVVIYLAGLVATNVFGRRLVHYGDRLLSRIPLVKSVYFSAKQLMEVFARKEASPFREAVYVEFPLDETYALAFITGDMAAVSGKRYYTCFVPTSPNPTSGFVLVLESTQVHPSGFSVEEAMKSIVSGGMVVPEVLRGARFQ